MEPNVVVVGVIDRLLVDHVDLALELVFGADRDEDADGVGAELLPHLVEDVVEIGAGAVHLVDEHDARHLVFGGLAPDGFGLRLDAGDAAEDDDRAIEHAQRALDFGREVHVAGGVDDVDALLLLRERACTVPSSSCCHHSVVTAAEVMVMPRSRSCSIQSVVAAPSCTSPILWIMPV